MNSMSIHNVTKVELANTSELATHDDGKPMGYVRHLEITDDKGNTLRVNLFSDDKDNLNCTFVPESTFGI